MPEGRGPGRAKFVRRRRRGVVFYELLAPGGGEGGGGGGFIAACSTRVGGKSAGEFSTLNLGYGQGDEEGNVSENRGRLSAALGLDPDAWVLGRQVHGSNVAVATPHDRGRGARGAESAIPGTDALVTDAGALPLAVLTADCAPVLLVDPVGRAAGVAHASWRGAAGSIVSVAIGAMAERFGSRPEDILAGVGPCIRPCCYEVKGDMRRSLEEGRGSSGELFSERGGRMYFDLERAALEDILRCGVLREKVAVLGLCTSCEAGEFFSWRRDGGGAGGGGRTGRMAAVAALL